MRKTTFAGLVLALACTAALAQTPATPTLSNPTVSTATPSISQPLSGTAVSGSAVAGQATAGPARSVPIGGPVQAGGGGGVPTQPATSPAEKAIEKFLQGKGNPGLTGRLAPAAAPELKALFPDYTFTFLTIPQWPIAREPQAPLKMTNIFAVDSKDAVTHLTAAADLQKFFLDHAPVLKGDDQLKAATAWATLSCEFFQDGMFKFIPGKPEILPTGSLTTNVRIVTTVDPAGGDSGNITSTVSIMPDGKFVSANDRSTLKAGMRPICQSTKLLDSDPLVRRMAQQDLLIMGERCFDYLDMMREKSSPDLQQAIDDIKQRILNNDRIQPRSE